MTINEVTSPVPNLATPVEVVKEEYLALQEGTEI